jgi:hypothetical protein
MIIGLVMSVNDRVYTSSAWSRWSSSAVGNRSRRRQARPGLGDHPTPAGRARAPRQDLEPADRGTSRACCGYYTADWYRHLAADGLATVIERRRGAWVSCKDPSMDSPTLTDRRSPWVIITTSDDPWTSSAEAELRRRGGVVIRLDGRQLLDPTSVFRTFAERFHFPGYFGHNWDALIDCLQDWHAHGYDGVPDIAILVDHADGLLETDFVEVLISSLAVAAWHVNLRLDADGIRIDDETPFTMHTVLLLDQTTPAAFLPATAAGTDIIASMQDGRLTTTLDPTEWPVSGTWPD